MRGVDRYFALALSNPDRLISPKKPLITSSTRARLVHDTDPRNKSAIAAEWVRLILVMVPPIQDDLALARILILKPYIHQNIHPTVGGYKHSLRHAAQAGNEYAPAQIYGLNSRTISTQAFTFSTGVSGRMP
jgi:hypothetical protein